MFFDSHCHLNFPDFEKDYQDIIDNCLENKVGLLVVGADFASSRRAVEIAEEYPNEPVYAAIGIHPTEVTNEGFVAEQMQLLITDKVVAVGEIGLDYFRAQNPANKTQDWKVKQKHSFIQQLEFAQKNNLPVILHARGSKEDPQDAYLDILDILKKQKLVSRSVIGSLGSEGETGAGVIHCFGSTQEIAQRFLELGFYVGFTGIITFTNKSADPLRQVVKSIPFDKILVETDAPYLTPEPHRGKRNLPQYVEFVTRKVAEIKGMGFEETGKMTSENVKTLFLSGFSS